MALAERPRLWLFVWATIIFWLQAWAWPFAPGRDGYSYLYYGYDFLNRNPEDYFTILFRTPIAGLFSWFLVDGLGAFAAEIFLWATFCLVLAALYEAAKRWGQRQAFIFACLMALQPGWGSLFHVFSNDPPMAILVPIVLLAALRWQKGWRSAAWMGALAGMGLLIRPGIFALWGSAVAMPPIGMLRRILRLGVFFLLLLPFYGGWVWRNHQQFGIAALAPGADVLFPLARLLAVEKNVRSDNGPASQKLAEAIEADIIARDETLAGWSADRFLQERAGYFDLILMADRVWGRGEYDILKKAAREALWREPVPYFTGATKNFLFTFAGNLKQPVPLQSGARIHTHKSHVSYSEGRRDQWAPVQNFDFTKNRRDLEISAQMRERGPKSAKAWERSAEFPVRDGSVNVGRIWNLLAYAFPPMVLWLVAGVVGWWIVGVRSVRDRILWSLVLVGLATNGLACLSIWSVVYEYRLPFDPLYVLFGWIPWVRFWRAKRGLSASPAGNALARG